MKKKIVAFMAGGLLIASNLFAGSGDFIIDGNVGVGTTTPTQKLDVNGSIRVLKNNWEGIYFDSTPILIWRGRPSINSKTFMIGNDDFISEVLWDTFRDGSWAYCEGKTGSGFFVNCANYSSMTANDYFWVFKHGSDSQHPESADLKILFDGESNDGVMGFMEDEDYFYFDDDVIFNDKVGIGTTTPTEKLEVAGAIKVANTTSTCNSTNAGTIKFVSPNFFGCNGTAWVQLNN